MVSKLIGITGPSSFSNELIQMVESFFESNPVLLYMDRLRNLKYWIPKLDAVILGGGVDIHPMTYQRSYPAKHNMKTFDPKRDKRECAIIDFCMTNHVPMLGICRGHQLLGVVRKKMQMVTDLCEESKIVHCPSIQEPKYIPDPFSPIHKVKILDDRELFGGTSKNGFFDLWVNSFHHQGLLFDKTAHEKDPHVLGLSYVTKEKSIIELMECPEEQWISAQWHPEFDYKEQDSSMRLLRHFKKTYIENNYYRKK